MSSLMELEGNEEFHVIARDMITKKLFDGLLYSTKKEERCSGTVWLVSLTMYCGRHPIIQKLLPGIQLVEDTEVFQEGSIEGNLSGGELNTYKELCSLANEIGQPDLIYKFMDFTKYQASLNSKRGATFGFSKIAKLAGDALQPYLRQLVHRLVRYQYDPDKNVQDAMAHIWKSLVAEKKILMNFWILSLKICWYNVDPGFGLNHAYNSCVNT